MDKPKIVVIVVDGETEKRYVAEDVKGYRSGLAVIFKRGKVLDRVVVPKNYVWRKALAPGKDLFLFPRYWPAVCRWRHSVGAVPLFGDAPDIPGDEYNELCLQHGMHQGYLALVGKGKIPAWLVIAILVVVVAVGAWYFMNRGSGEEVPTEGQVPVEGVVND